LEILSRKYIKIISVEDKIEIVSPKEIILNAGGSQLKISDKGIFIETPRLFHVKAGQHKFDSGAIVNYPVPNMPSLYYGSFNLTDEYNNPLIGQKYKLTLPSGKEILGLTDDQGKTLTGYSAENNQDIKLEVIENINEDIWYQPESTFEYEQLDSMEYPIVDEDEVENDD